MMRWYQEQELADIVGVRDLTEYSSKSTDVKVQIGSLADESGNGRDWSE